MKNITEAIFNDQNIIDYIDSQLHNNWSGTPFENYPRLDPKAKGGFGELYVESLMTMLGSVVKDPTNPGHDRIIDGLKTEIKFSVANSNTKKGKKLIDPDSFTFNHVAVNKDWDQFIFCGINPDNDNENVRSTAECVSWPSHRVYVMNKKDFKEYMSSCESTIFRCQQGGNGSGNDDYIVAGRINFYKLIKLSFVKELTIEVPNDATK
jgi:hypothetical protein